MTNDRPTVFEAALETDWRRLAPAVRELHAWRERATFSGRAEVRRGTSLLSRLGGWFARFPKAGDDVRLTLTKTRVADGEFWERDFGGARFGSTYRAARAPRRYRETIRGVTMELALTVEEEGGLRLDVVRGWAFGLPIPQPLLPFGEIREFEAEGVFRFDMALHAPMAGLIVHYRGWLKPD